MTIRQFLKKPLFSTLGLFFLATSCLNGQDTFSGNVFLDHNSDQSKAGLDTGQPSIRIRGYDDTNNNSILDAGDIVVGSDITDVNGNYSLSLNITGTTFTKNLLVQQSEDDAEENISTKSVSRSSSDLELIEDGSSTPQVVGIRFDGIKIPKGVTITNAYIRFKGTSNENKTCNLSIKAEKNATSPKFSSTNADISSRLTTTDSVTWSPGSWSKNNFYNSPDISTLITELNNMTSWDEDSPVTIIITGSGERTAYSYNGSSTAPELIVEFTNPYLGNRYFITLEDAEIATGSTITLPSSTYYTYTTGLGSTTNVDFGFNGETKTCYALSDNDQDAGLSVMNRVNGREQFIGLTGETQVEAMAINPVTSTMYLADPDQLFTVDPLTGSATSLSQIFGTGTSTILGISIDFNDVDGLAFDAITGILWGSTRRGSHDALFQIDHTTGAYISDAFGTGEDFVLIDDTGNTIPDDVDDIAINPENGKLYGIANNASFDLLIEINKSTGVATIIDTIKTATGAIVKDMEGFSFTSYGEAIAVSGDGSISPNAQWGVDLTNAKATYIGTYDYNDDYESCECLTAKTNTLSGTVFYDDNGNGIWDGSDNGIQNVTVYIYIDEDNDGKIGVGDVLIDSVDTDVNGDWSRTLSSNVDLLFMIDTNDLPSGALMTTDNEEIAALNAGIGGQTDASNDFAYNYTGPLPVELTSFEGTSERCKIKLAWTTETEENFSFFQIERSLDGQRFEQVAMIEGQNNPTGAIYSYEEQAPGYNVYYRLKNIDLDGSFEFSEVINIKVDCGDAGKKIKIYPNPILSNNARVNVLPPDTQLPTSIQLVNIEGKILYQMSIETGIISMDLEGLTPGMYIIQGKNGQRPFAERLIILAD